MTSTTDRPLPAFLMVSLRAERGCVSLSNGVRAKGTIRFSGRDSHQLQGNPELPKGQLKLEGKEQRARFGSGQDPGCARQTG